MEAKSILKNEIQESTDDRMEKLNRILSSIEKCSKREMGQVPTSYDRLAEHERKLLEILLHIIYLKDVPDNKFSAFVTKTLNVISQKDQLISILRARRDTNYNNIAVSKIKAFTQRWGEENFNKAVFKQI